jgi:hypothetical protein
MRDNLLKHLFLQTVVISPSKLAWLIKRITGTADFDSLAGEEIIPGTKPMPIQYGSKPTGSDPASPAMRLKGWRFP